MIDVVPLRFGTAFKKAFRDPEVLSAFVRDATGISVDLKQVQQEYTYKEPIGRVNVTYDLFAEDTTHRTIVELQHIRDDDSFDRFLYYHLLAIIEQVHGHANYHFDREVITLVVLTRAPRDPRWRFDLAELPFDVRDSNGTSLGFFGHRLVFVNARCVSSTTPAALRPWLAVVEDSLDGQVDEKQHPNALIKRVINEIRVERLDPNEAMHLAEENGWEIAKKEAREAGHDEGEARGRAAGRAEAIVDLLVSRNLPVSDAVRTCLFACRDLPRLKQWLLQATTVASAEALVLEDEATP